MKKISLSIHSNSNFDFSNSLIYQHLNSLFEISVKDNAMFHLYFDYTQHDALEKNYRNHINIHITNNPTTIPKPYIPDFNIYDYALGYEDIDFFGRYYNLTETHSLSNFLIQIFTKNAMQKKQKGISKLYFNIWDNIWKNNLLIHTYNLDFSSKKFHVLLILTKILFKLYEFLLKVITIPSKFKCVHLKRKKK